MINRILDTQIRNMKSGEEIDALIAEKIFGMKFRKPGHGTCCTCQTCGYHYDDCICGYSTYLEKAWDVIEAFQFGKYPSKFATNCEIDININEDVYECKIQSPTLLVSASADCFSLAVCRCALLAILSE